MSRVRHPFVLMALVALLATPFTVSADEIGLPWMTDVNAAKEKAAKEGKDLLINFTGSDWCIWCKRLEGEVFSQPEFVNAMGDKYVYLYLDFPHDEAKKKEVKDPELNAQLQKKYKVAGFPSVVLTTSTGVLYAKTGYQPDGAENYIEHLEKIDGDATKVKALLADDGKDEAKSETVLLAAMPILAKNELLGFDEYGPALERVRKIDTDGKLGLLKFAQGMDENKALDKLFAGFGSDAPDWEKAYALLAKSPHAFGQSFVNPAFGCARRLQEQKRYADAKALYERVLADPMLADNKKAHEVVGAAIAECQKGVDTEKKTDS